MRLLSALVATLMVAIAKASQLTEIQFETYTELESALLNNRLNLFSLAETFYPPIGHSLICVPVNYHITCDYQEMCSTCVNCTQPEGYNASYLWTVYDVSAPIGPLLLSYASSGIGVRGFNWEESCTISQEITLELAVTSLNHSNESVIMESLLGMTAKLKAYAKAQGTPRALGNSDTKGYATQWDTTTSGSFYGSRILLITMIAVLDVFILFFAIGTTAYTYQGIYIKAKKKKKPGYPIFWGLVVVSICWNVAPAWLVLSNYTYQVYISLSIMIPLELIVAIGTKKKSDFPIPGLDAGGCSRHRELHFTWELAILRCCRCMVGHLAQVIAIWSILISFTFILYYLSAIIVAFYLYPVLTLVKLLFLKAVAIVLILNVALLFSLDRFRCEASFRVCKNNFITAVMLITIVMFLLIVGYLTFVIGGILFSQSTEISGIEGIFTVLPSLFLVVAAWYSHGRLFPDGIMEADPAAEIVTDLEKGVHKTTHAATPPKQIHSKDIRSGASSHPATPRSHVSELSTYNSMDTHPPLVTDSTPVAIEGEGKPLLHP